MNNFEKAMHEIAIAKGNKGEGSKGKRLHRTYEENLQQQCVTWFDARWGSLRQMLHHSPNESKYDRERMKHAAMGTRPGFPDLIWLSPMKSTEGIVPFVGIEFKYGKKGRQSEEQKDYQRMFEELGAEYYIVKTGLRFKELVINLLERSMMNGSIYLNKTEEAWLYDARMEVKELRELERKTEELAAAAKLAKVQRVRKGKATEVGDRPSGSRVRKGKDGGEHAA